FKDTCELLNKHFTGLENEIYERFIFRRRTQGEDESFLEFITDLRLKFKSCNFGEFEQSLPRDQIVLVIGCDKTRLDLLKAPKLTADEALKICLANESSKIKLSEIKKDDKAEESVCQIGQGNLGYRNERNKLRRNITCKFCGDS